MAGHGSVNSIRGQFDNLRVAEDFSNTIRGNTKSQKESPPEKKVEGSDANKSDPLMPHLVFNDQELEERYPRLTAPEDEHADDPAIDAADLTLQVGQRIAEEIRGSMRAEGRRRRKMTSSVFGVCGGATDGRPSTCVFLGEFCEGATAGRPLANLSDAQANCRLERRRGSKRG